MFSFQPKHRCSGPINAHVLLYIHVALFFPLDFCLLFGTRETPLVPLLPAITDRYQSSVGMHISSQYLQLVLTWRDGAAAVSGGEGSFLLALQ